jgi:hypothetical protein
VSYLKEGQAVQFCLSCVELYKGVKQEFFNMTAAGGSRQHSQSQKTFQGGKKLKTKRKVLSILVTMSILLMLLVPLAGVAGASGDIEALTVPRVRDTDSQTLGTLKVTVDAGSVKDGDVIIFKLTEGYDYGSAFSTDTTNSSVINGVYIPSAIGSAPNGLTNLAVTVLDANDEVQLTAGADQSLNNDFVFYIYMRDVDVKGGTTADNAVAFSGPTNTGFPKGTATNVKVTSGAGRVDLTVRGADISNDDFTFDLRVEETVAGSLREAAESIKLSLPAGFKWDNIDPGVSLLWGDGVTAVDFIFAGEDVTIDVTGASTKTSAWDFNGLTFHVSDDTLAKAGAVNIKISGTTDIVVAAASVGTYVSGATMKTTLFTIGSMN